MAYRELDETFGQYPAFPVPSDNDKDSLEVAQYLKCVREDAERDAPVYYAADDSAAKCSTTLLALTTPAASDWESHVVLRFKALQILIGREQQSVHYNTPETAAQWRKLVFDQSPPPISVLLGFDRATVFKLVVYIMRWLSLSANENLSRWTWLVLARVQDPLDPSEYALIHDLGKKAQKLYSKKYPEDFVGGTNVSRFTIDLVRVIVGRCFGQTDILELIHEPDSELLQE